MTVVLSGKPKIDSYDYILVMFSGGKDSTACVLDLIDRGVDMSKVELWHQDVDGREGSELMDWPVTRDYCKKFADAFDIPIYFQWKIGGIEGELFKKNAKTTGSRFETPEGKIKEGGGVAGKVESRLMWPSQGSMEHRWCTNYAKMSPASIALNNQERFIGKKILYISGERWEESKQRSSYKPFIEHGTSSGKKTVHHWRSILDWSEEDVWNILKRYKVMPHPAYYVGFGRVSCSCCIFLQRHDWATLADVWPEKVVEIFKIEKKINHTIQTTGKNVLDFMQSVGKDGRSGESYYDKKNAKYLKVLLSKKFTLPMITKSWELPSGAYRKSGGPS